MRIDISKKDRLTVETFQGNAHGKQFTGVRFRVGKRSPKTVFHFHHSKVWEVIEALKMVVSSINSNSGSFYEATKWQRLRYETLKKFRKCCLCGSSENLHVDHIKPRSKFPQLELEPNNLQVLCAQCNLAKSNMDCEDYR